jgi:serine/threonine protein kinase
VNCPSEEELVEIIEGRASSDRIAALDDHLDTCEDCLLVVGALARGRSLPSSSSEPPPDAPPLGERLVQGDRIGRYVIESVRGTGGMGVVYAARDENLNRPVALKLVHPRLARGERAHERMRHEALAMAQLQHPHVLRIYDIEEQGDRVLIAMELIEGETLRSWQRDRSVADIIAAYEDAGDALHAAHESGLVHRDFKPDNVLVDTTGAVKVTDFGLAATVSRDVVDGAPSSRAPSSRRGSSAAGTPPYMAPEQLRGKRVDRRADQYGFCVSLYEALYGARPFAGDTPGELLDAIEQGPEPPAARAIPPGVEEALARGLSFEPKERFASMEELLSAVREATSSSQARRWPSWVWLGPAGLLAAVLVLSFSEGDAAKPIAPDTSSRTSSAEPPEVPATALSSTEISSAEPVSSSEQPSPVPEPTASEPTVVAPSTPPPRPSPAPPTQPARSRSASAFAGCDDDRCKKDGACTPSANGCIAASDADCRLAAVCDRHGECKAQAGRCVAGSDADCKASLYCAVGGYCAKVGTACKPTRAEHCKNAGGCSSQGRCSLENHKCVIGSRADCMRTESCRLSGKCTPVGGKCQVASDADCKLASVCKKYGNCRAQGGKCVATDPP